MLERVHRAGRVIVLLATFLAVTGIARGQGKDDLLEGVVARDGFEPAEVAALGEAALPEVLRMLAEDTTLPEDFRIRLREALALFDRASLFSSLDRFAETGDLSERLVVLALVRDLGGADQVGLALRAGRLPGADGGAEERLAEGVQRALTELLKKDRDTLRELDGGWWGATHRVRVALLRAVGQSGSGEGLPFLADLLGRDGSLDGIVLSQIDRLAQGAGAARGSVSDRVRPYLGASHPGLRKAAAIALGKLGDVASVGDLVAMLEGPEGERSSAHWALRRITGRSFRADALRWAAWHREELRWAELRLPVLLPLLESEERATLVRTLDELADHPLFADETVAPTELLLQAADPSIRGLACDVLGRLGSAAALPALLEVLEYDSEEVWPRAWRALRSITGWDLPAEPGPWRARMFPESPPTSSTGFPSTHPMVQEGASRR